MVRDLLFQMVYRNQTFGKQRVLDRKWQKHEYCHEVGIHNTIQKSKILEPELCQAEITDLGIVNAIQYDVEPEWRMLKTWCHKHWSWKHCQNSGISRHIPNSLMKTMYTTIIIVTCLFFLFFSMCGMNGSIFRGLSRNTNNPHTLSWGWNDFKSLWTTGGDRPCKKSTPSHTWLPHKKDSSCV